MYHSAHFMDEASKLLKRTLNGMETVYTIVYLLSEETITQLPILKSLVLLENFGSGGPFSPLTTLPPIPYEITVAA